MFQLSGFYCLAPCLAGQQRGEDAKITCRSKVVITGLMIVISTRLEAPE